MKLFYLSIFLVLSACATKSDRLPTKTLTEKIQELESAKDEDEKFYILSHIAKEYAAEPLTAENSAQAQSYAESLLKSAPNYKKNWNYGNAIHHGNLVLGRVKLFEGNVTEAKKYLRLASLTPGSPQLIQFGPNATLASELLAKGEKKAVINYLDNCSKFWKSAFAKKQIASWKQSIKADEEPEFRENLIY